MLRDVNQMRTADLNFLKIWCVNSELNVEIYS